MLSLISGFLDSIPPLVKEIILLILGVVMIRAAWKGGAARDNLFNVAK